jgi:hypothetical protein
VTPDEINQQCINSLEAAGLPNRVVVVGSGPSSQYIAPIDELEKQLHDRCGVTKGSKEEFWLFTERAYNSNPGEYYSVIRQAYGSTPHWTANAYEHVVKIPFLGFATLNYDEQLPREFRAQRPDGGFFVYPQQPGQRFPVAQEFLSPPPRLVALHGYRDDANPRWEREVILKVSDYNEHYTNSPARLFDWWTSLLLDIPCIFIGTSLREPGLYEVIRAILPEHRDLLTKRNHVHLTEAKRNAVTGTYDPPDTTLGIINQVLYHREDARFTGLLKVLSHFSGIPVDSPSPNRLRAPERITASNPIDFGSL